MSSTPPPNLIFFQTRPIQGFSSRQNIGKAAAQRKKGVQEFEAVNLCAIILCCEIGCGYKSLEDLTKEYK